MILVRVSENESIEDVLKRFKLLCEKEGILYEIKRRRFFRSLGKKKASKTRRAKYLRRKMYSFIRRFKN